MNVSCMVSNATLKEMFRNAATAALLCNGNAHHVNDMDDAEIGHKLWKIGIEYGHESVLEHVTLTFYIENLSRACLQELARHRHISMSVESTRHGLEHNIARKCEYAAERMIPLINVLDYDDDIKHDVNVTLKKLLDFVEFHCVNKGTENDLIKYLLPETFPTKLYLTLNLREFLYIIKLRSKEGVLHEFKALCAAMVKALPTHFENFGNVASLISKDEQ